jgi:uncharacterized repeat protein (TIGR03803 family)
VVNNSLYYAEVNNGTMFQISTNGTGYIALKYFTYSPDGGANPQSVPVLSEGALYGTTQYGGSSGNGTAFMMNTNGTGFVVLKTFTGSTDGANPYSGLTKSGTTLYGTTAYGGNSGNGTIFALTLPLPFAIDTTNGNFGFTNLQFQFTLTGPAGSNVLVLASTNLQTWIPLATNSLTGGSINFTDGASTNFLLRFYRATLQ